ncbi:MAG: RNA pseudouridine synthase [Planctomycetota bacterium]
MFDPRRSVLHDEGGILVVDKWPGTPSTGRSLEDPDCVQWHIVGWAGTFVWAVHQLDADTSGVLVFARRRELVAPLKTAMAHHAARKEYLAWVAGSPGWEKICHAGAIGPAGERRGVPSLGVTPDGRAARSTLRVARRGRDAALVHARIHTGRTHQVRIHLSDLGHAVLGDDWYGDGVEDRAERQALHAVRLVLGPPFDRTFESPIPPDLSQLSAELGLSECGDA